MSMDNGEIAGSMPVLAEPRRRSRARWVIAVVTAAALVVVGGGAGVLVWNAGENSRHAEAMEQWQQALDRLEADLAAAEAVADDLAAVVEESSAAPVVEGVVQAVDVESAGGDDLAAFALLVAEKRELDLSIDPGLSRAQKIDRAGEVVTAVELARGDLARDVGVLQLSVTSNRVAHVLADVLEPAATDLDAAVAAVGESLPAAQEHLAASEGDTLDDSARVALTGAIDSAAAAVEVATSEGVEPGRALLDDAVGLLADLAAALDDADFASVNALMARADQTLEGSAEITAALPEHAAELRAHVDALAGARDAVTQAQNAKAAAAAAARASGGTKNTGGSQTRPGGSSTGNQSAGASAPAAKGGSGSSGSSGSGSTSGSGGGSSGGGTWVEEGSGTWCDTTDTSGADGVGGWC
ncbi:MULTISPECIES: hypothetical protein [unclassified Cellulomonas]|uniref:hypothetical protein n=1 Tax=unclassified Cellulomonas TaxID=2620175 RepID=UPI001C4EBF8D|nr:MULTISPECIES: hypothetical protein [unclassified Cellulomonas]MBW0255835.1 hypothetical protein [Cellulomonas sp. PS-H5]MCG7288058.1 hypothetical protein [Cellulomonas sp. ACRRI]